MVAASWAQIAAVFALLLASTPVLGNYLAKVYGNQKAPGDTFFLPVERLIYRLLRIDPDSEQRWTAFVGSAVALTLVGVLLNYLVFRVQHLLPGNPDHFGAVSPPLAFNTAVSFVTNTDWQNYTGESTLSQFSQMFALVVHQFLSAAIGMALAAAFIRGVIRTRTTTLGNFWVDTVRSLVRVLVPMSFAFAIVLLAGGVIDNFHPTRVVSSISGLQQSIPGGPVASMVPIEMIGDNGGGYFGANMAHPFQNPNPVINVLTIWLAASIPFAFPWAYGRLVGSMRQATVVIVAMATLYTLSVVLVAALEAHGNSHIPQFGIAQYPTADNPGGNLEGKDLRLGATGSALNAVTMTSTSTGGVNAAMESYTPLGGGLSLSDMMLGEVIPGGTGTGLYGMLIFVLITSFIAGLMVGRTPMYLGKRLLAGDMTLAAIYILVLPVTLLTFAGISLLLPSAAHQISTTGPHAVTEVVYAYTSAAHNNGSAFAGLAGNTPWYNSTLGLAMWVGRFFEIIPALALAGSLASKRKYTVTAGTLRTDTPLFTALLAAIVVILVGLTYFPVLALGPMAEHFSGHFGV
ncbi:K+-transporting ATPase subunit A [Mycobacterium sp. E2699]|uniref:potassium-transporting ATPase subunit KdpA n=1 Tax=Mycobacterium sp. E2699 TaxID=1834137 RepID=UPI0007FDB9DD|nr:potassium-transporting ATPase subunit KdpA [Mycobacterium sp. E2699]OBH02554.1 K+-transporting ATPase subunit A [Mycobacterium sp. E2699]